MKKERFTITKHVSIFGIIGNIFLFVIKIIIGVISHSRSMIADAFNSAGDVFASLLSWIGNKISSVPNDNDHNYGHGKAEYIFSMLISLSMISISLKLLYDSVFSILNKDQLLFSWNLIIVAFITITIKIILYFYTRYCYKKSDNLLIKSTMIDHRNDILLTFLTLIAIIFSKYNIYYVDGIVGIIISLWICYSGIKIFKESYDVLMDSAISEESKSNIKEIIQSYQEIKRVGDMYSIPIGYNYIIILTIYVDGNMNTIASHEIADILEKDILKKISRIEKVLVHVEPFFDKKKK